MGATVLVVLLAGLVLPILLILTAVLVDAVAIGWALYRMWHDDWGHRVWEFISLHLIAPLLRLTHARVPVVHR